jgi:hypothetical protein
MGPAACHPAACQAPDEAEQSRYAMLAAMLPGLAANGNLSCLSRHVTAPGKSKPSTARERHSGSIPADYLPIPYRSCPDLIAYRLPRYGRSRRCGVCGCCSGERQVGRRRYTNDRDAFFAYPGSPGGGPEIDSNARGCAGCNQRHLGARSRRSRRLHLSALTRLLFGIHAFSGPRAKSQSVELYRCDAEFPRAGR